VELRALSAVFAGEYAGLTRDDVLDKRTIHMVDDTTAPFRKPRLYGKTSSRISAARRYKSRSLSAPFPDEIAVCPRVGLGACVIRSSSLQQDRKGPGTLSVGANRSSQCRTLGSVPITALMQSLAARSVRAQFAAGQLLGERMRVHRKQPFKKDIFMDHL